MKEPSRKIHKHVQMSELLQRDRTATWDVWDQANMNVTDVLLFLIVGGVLFELLRMFF